MKALTICNPYPELILLGEKPIENRERRWSYRGQLLIHAGKSRQWMRDGDYHRYPNLSWGAIVGVMTVPECLELDSLEPWPPQYAHLRRHEHANGPWCLIAENVKRFVRPVSCAGALGLWDITTHKDADRIVPLVLAELKAVV